MSNNQIIDELLLDQKIKQRVETVWTKVFEASNKVLKHANSFGFSMMGIVPSPNIYEMLVTLQILSSVIDVLITNADRLGIGYEETRLMLNAKEQMTRMERVATALKANDRAGFDDALADLERQAAF